MAEIIAAPVRAGEPLVRVDDAVVTFGHTTVLGPLSLTLHAGSTVAILGHNGAGKTTLLRLLCGNVVASGGSVKVAGLDPTTQWRQVAAMVGSSFYPERAFYYRLTVDQNLKYFQSLQKIFRGEAARERDEITAATGIQALRDQKFMELSLGQRKRLGLAKAMIGDPPLMLLDEPLANLDDEGREVVTGVLEERQKRGLTTIFSTHQMVDVRDVVTDVVTVSKGSVAVESRLSEGATATRPVRITGAAGEDCDLSDMFARYESTVVGGEVSLLVPVDVPLSTVIGMAESLGMLVDSVSDGSQLVSLGGV